MATVTFSIGTSSRDYSTITSWEADLDNTGLYNSGDDAVGECYNDSEFDETVTIDGGGTVGLNSVNLSVASGERHDGTPGTGARIGFSTNRQVVVNTTVPVRIEWLEVDANGNYSGDSNGIIYIQSDPPAPENHLANLLVHSVVASEQQMFVLLGAATAYITNCFFFDLECTHAGGHDAYGVYGQVRLFELYNCTIHDIVNNNGSGIAQCVRFVDDSDTIIKNCIATDPSGTASGAKTCFAITSPSNATVSHNLSSDTTAGGTGSLTSKSSADQFISNTAPYDLHLKSGADAIDAGTDLGTTPAGVEIDIDGRNRDTEGDTWDIGADEFVSASGITFNASVQNINMGIQIDTLQNQKVINQQTIQTIQPVNTQLNVQLPNTQSIQSQIQLDSYLIQKLINTKEIQLFLPLSNRAIQKNVLNQDIQVDLQSFTNAIQIPITEQGINTEVQPNSYLLEKSLNTQEINVNQLTSTPTVLSLPDEQIVTLILPQETIIADRLIEPNTLLIPLVLNANPQVLTNLIAQQNINTQLQNESYQLLKTPNSQNINTEFQVSIFNLLKSLNTQEVQISNQDQTQVAIFTPNQQNINTEVQTRVYQFLKSLSTQNIPLIIPNYSIGLGDGLTFNAGVLQIPLILPQETLTLNKIISPQNIKTISMNPFRSSILLRVSDFDILEKYNIDLGIENLYKILLEIE